jgi:hypothetical protein
MSLRRALIPCLLGSSLLACAPDEPRDQVYWDQEGKADDPAVEDQLPDAFDEEDPLACGNASLDEADLPAIEGKMDSTEEWKILETEHFRIRYQTDGDNEVLASFLDLKPHDGVPDFVNHVATGAEEGYAKYIDEWGLPPDDGRTPIWIKDAQGYFGYVSQGQIVMDNDSFAFAISRHFLRATVAHEYFHVVQHNLAGNWPAQDSWFTEASAVWAEQQSLGLWDGLVGGFIRDLLLTDRLRKNLDKSLTEKELLNGPYSTFVFPQFLAERFDGHRTIAELFRKVREGNSILAATSAIAEEAGTDFDTIFREYTVWNYLVGSRDDGQHYSDGRSFFHRVASSKVEASHGRLPEEWQDSESTPERYAASYVELDVPGDAAAINVEVEANAGLNWAVSLLIKRDDVWETRHPEAASGGSHSLLVEDLADADRLVLVVQQLGSLPTAALHFRYRASAQ